MKIIVLLKNRLEKIKEKYRLIREQKISERVESLGVEISDTDTKEDLLTKRKRICRTKTKYRTRFRIFLSFSKFFSFSVKQKIYSKT